MPRKSFLPIIFLIFLVFMVYFVLYNQLFSENKFVRIHSRPHVSPDTWIFRQESSELSDLILDTPACRIPRTPIFPDFIKGKWKRDDNPDCSYEQVVGKRNESHFILYPEYQNRNCTAAEILRDPQTDNGFLFSDWTTIKSELELNEWEHFVVQCGLSLNFETNWITPKSVQKKLDFWNNLKFNEAESTQKDAIKPRMTPVNLILIGIDSVSRSHAYRSLPKTLQLFKQLGFHDFQGYHSIGPDTLANFFAFLGGIQYAEVRKTCATSWSSIFDPCPFIWKNYSSSNYVTLYVEDGPSTFNWGGQSGFRVRPTDYYAYHLFNAVEKMRLQSKRNNTHGLRKHCLHSCCHSNETSPQFLTRYVKEFVKKFQAVAVPFFSFTWYDYPFHDSQLATQTLDDQLYDLYNFFASSSGILENSVLIFNGDHGDRHQFYPHLKMYGYIERGLPPLFIRIPEKLLAMYPEMRLNEVVAENTHELVSPFDLHHTLLHLLNFSTAGLPSNQKFSNEFVPILPDRRSLFTPVKGRNGSCEMLNLNPQSCVCNTVLESEVIDNPLYLDNIAETLESALNALIRPEVYEKLCAKWSVKGQHLIYNHVISKMNTSSVFLVRFGAKPPGAEFEARVQITHVKTAFDSVKLHGQMTRINAYGDQSACLRLPQGRHLTDFDKEIKSFCYCKDKVKKS